GDLAHLLERILADSSRRRKGLRRGCERARDPAKAGVLSETAGAWLRPRLNVLHRRVETDFGARPRARLRPVRTLGAAKPGGRAFERRLAPEQGGRQVATRRFRIKAAAAKPERACSGSSG